MKVKTFDTFINESKKTEMDGNTKIEVRYFNIDRNKVETDKTIKTLDSLKDTFNLPFDTFSKDKYIVKNTKKVYVYWDEKYIYFAKDDRELEDVFEDMMAAMKKEVNKNSMVIK